ncbi:hypothetical protein D0Z03_001610 [Geotrichum reessii]|nr:hypothetical protein D0Z03_001610 [Galactomyces reessii]
MRLSSHCLVNDDQELVVDVTGDLAAIVDAVGMGAAAVAATAPTIMIITGATILGHRAGVTTATMSMTAAGPAAAHVTAAAMMAHPTAAVIGAMTLAMSAIATSAEG